MVVTAGGTCRAGLGTVVVVVVGSAIGATGRVVVVVVDVGVVVVVVVDDSLDGGSSTSASASSAPAGAAIGTNDAAFVARFIATGSGSGALNGAAAEMFTSCPTARSRGCAVIRSSNWKSLTVGDGTTASGAESACATGVASAYDTATTLSGSYSAHCVPSVL